MTPPVDPPTLPAVTVNDPGNLLIEDTEVYAAVDLMANAQFAPDSPVYELRTYENQSDQQSVLAGLSSSFRNNLPIQYGGARSRPQDFYMNKEGERAVSQYPYIQDRVYWGKWYDNQDSDSLPFKHWVGGISTSELSLPQNGSATYRGTVHGIYDKFATSGVPGTVVGGMDRSELEGRMDFSVNFGIPSTSSSTGSGLLTMSNFKDSSTNSTLNIPDFYWDVAIDENELNAQRLSFGNTNNYDDHGVLLGSFFGDEASLVGGQFFVNYEERTENIVSISGVFEGEKITDSTTNSRAEQLTQNGQAHLQTADLGDDDYEFRNGNAPSGITIQSRSFNHKVDFGSNDHLSWGTWNSTPSTPTRPLKYWIQGQLTPANRIPTTGTATYSGSVFGSYIRPADSVTFGGNGNPVGVVTGDLALKADFGQRRVYGQFNNLQGGDLPSSIDVDSSIHKNSSVFSGVTKGNNGIGEFAGGFFGPNYQAIGGVWSYRTDTYNYNGIFQGTR